MQNLDYTNPHDHRVNISTQELGSFTETDRAAAESVVERLYNAVECLCVGAGDVRSRLLDAIHAISILQPHEFPKEVQSDFVWVMTQMSRYPAAHHNEGSFAGTMRRIKRQTGVQIAKRILHIYARVQDIRGCPVL